MKIDDFTQALSEHNVELNDNQITQFNLYFELLVEWNKKMNLTAITEENEVYLKHFFDSISPSFYYDFSKIKTVCDIGAGAGFPSIPLKICFPHLQITIVDSLNKRINFLNELATKLGLTDVNFVHSRAEDFGQQKENREAYDVVTARAVARTNVLSEYCLPVCKINGQFIAMKGSLIDNELAEASNAIEILGGKIKEEITFTLPIEKSDRSILIVDKLKMTPKKYPRKAGTPQKSPL